MTTVLAYNLMSSMIYMHFINIKPYHALSRGLVYSYKYVRLSLKAVYLCRVGSLRPRMGTLLTHSWGMSAQVGKIGAQHWQVALLTSCPGFASLGGHARSVAA